MQGTHLTADLEGCDNRLQAMTDIAALRAICVQAVTDVGLHAVGELFHRFPAPGGVTGVVLLAESHLAVHTWPELQAVTLDVYVCNLGTDNRDRAHSLLRTLVAAFSPRHSAFNELGRGEGQRHVKGHMQDLPPRPKSRIPG